MNYYVAYHFRIFGNGGVNGFGSTPLQNIEFNPFTITGVVKIGEMISDLIFEGKANIVVINIIPLENE